MYILAIQIISQSSQLSLKTKIYYEVYFSQFVLFVN